MQTRITIDVDRRLAELTRREKILYLQMFLLAALAVLAVGLVLAGVLFLIVT